MSKLKKIRLGLIAILFVCLIVFGYQIVLYSGYVNENKRLIGLKNEYEDLKKDISDYTELKNNYMIALEEEKNLKGDYSGLESKVNELNKKINTLQNQINDIKKKIDDIS